MRATADTPTSARADETPNHNAEVISRFIPEQKRHEVEKIITRQSTGGREVLQKCVANVTEGDLITFMRETTEDDLDDMLRALTRCDHAEHDDDDGDEQQTSEDISTFRLRQLLRTRMTKDRLELQKEWEMHDAVRYKDEDTSHSMRRTTWRGKVFGNLRQHCLDHIGLDLWSSRRARGGMLH